MTRARDLADGKHLTNVDSNTLVVDATNNRVGVGVASPQSVTHFKGTASGQNVLHLDNSAGSAHGDTNNNVRVVSGDNGYWANLVIAGQQLEFKVQGGSTGFTAESDGDLSIADGNLVLASGHGIDFSATGSGDDSTGQTVQAELLNDYEHGLWTPTVNGDTTYHHQYGMYQKIGRQVTAWFRLKINAANTPGANFYMDGLPYNNDHNGYLGGTGLVFYFSSIATSTIMMTARIDGGGSTINFTGNGASGTSAQFVNIAWVSNNAEIQGMVTYMTDYT